MMIKVTKKLVRSINVWAIGSHDEEAKALCRSWRELTADVKFLSERSMNAASMSFVDPRDCGASSNSIVAIAYGLQKFKDQELPSDMDDLQACFNMWDKLPKHRKTNTVQAAFTVAIIHIDKKFPDNINWQEVPAKVKQ